MPHEALNVRQVARYLDLPDREVLRLAARGRLPARRVAGGFEFRKGQLDQWVEQHMPGLSRDRLAGIERGVTAHHGLDARAVMVASLLPPDGVRVPLGGRTRDGVLRALTDVAEEAGLVYERGKLLEELRRRERLGSTAIFPGVALPHPTRPLPYHIAESFIVTGLAPGGIPFGCRSGELTRLFFMICCKDERSHLHVLARLARMLDGRTVEALSACQDAAQLRGRVLARERELLDS